MKSLKLMKNEYGLRVFCSKCNRNLNYDKLYQCKHGEKSQKYKQYVYKHGSTHVETYNLNDYDNALIAAINFKKAVQQSNYGKVDSSKPTSENLTLKDAANFFCEYKNGDNVPFHLRKELGASYLSSIRVNIKYFIEVIEKEFKINSDYFLFEDVNEYHVGAWAEYISKNFEKGSWNTRNTILKMLFTYTIKKFRITMYNPFEDVKRVQSEGKTETITKREFTAVLNAMESASKYEKMGGKQKQIYRFRDYLNDVFLIALHTGLRREEYLTLSWHDLQYHNNQWLIVVDNKKVERITGKKFKPKVVVIHEELEKILLNLGWKSDKIKSYDFIIKPNRTAKVETMEKCCTAAFSHYYKCAFPNEKHKTLGALRNTYLSCLNRETGDDMIELSSHGSMKTLNKHYIDPKLIARAANMKIFGDLNS